MSSPKTSGIYISFFLFLPLAGPPRRKTTHKSNTQKKSTKMIEELGKILTQQHNTRPQEATKPSKSPRGESKSFLLLLLLLLLKSFDWSCCVLCLLIFLWDGLRRGREGFLGGGFGLEVKCGFGVLVIWLRFGESWFDSVFCLFVLFVRSGWLGGWLAGWLTVWMILDRWIGR